MSDEPIEPAFDALEIAKVIDDLLAIIGAAMPPDLQEQDIRVQRAKQMSANLKDPKFFGG